MMRHIIRSACCHKEQVGKRHPEPEASCPPAMGATTYPSCSGQMGEKEKQNGLSTMKGGRTGDSSLERNILM